MHVKNELCLQPTNTKNKNSKTFVHVCDVSGETDIWLSVMSLHLVSMPFVTLLEYILPENYIIQRYCFFPGCLLSFTK